jgi:hypothetical protein
MPKMRSPKYTFRPRWICVFRGPHFRHLNWLLVDDKVCKKRTRYDWVREFHSDFFVNNSDFLWTSRNRHLNLLWVDDKVCKKRARYEPYDGCREFDHTLWLIRNQTTVLVPGTGTTARQDRNTVAHTAYCLGATSPPPLSSTVLPVVVPSQGGRWAHLRRFGSSFILEVSRFGHFSHWENGLFVSL